jgi:hypothetical protein
MSGKSNSKGDVTIYKAAIENAITYKNYFANNSTEKLTKESTVWLSKKNYNEFISAKKTSIALDFSIQEFAVQNEEKFKTKLKNKVVNFNAFSAKSNSSINNLIILKDVDNPLILKMQVKDFFITLKSVE